MENSTTMTPIISSVTLQFWNQYYSHRFIPKSIFLVTLIIFGILGNVIVVSVYILRPRLRTYGRYFIPYLAVVDLLSIVFSGSLGLIKCFRFVIFPGDAICKLLTCTTYTSVFASLLLLLFISVQRYVKICRPFGRQFSNFECRLFLILSIILPGVLSIPLTVVTGTFHVTNEKLALIETRCGFVPKYVAGTTAYRKIGAMIPSLEICIMTFIYYKIWRYMPTQKQTTTKNDSDTEPKPKNRSGSDLTRCILSTYDHTSDRVKDKEDHRISMENNEENVGKVSSEDVVKGEATMFHSQRSPAACFSKINAKHERNEMQMIPGDEREEHEAVSNDETHFGNRNVKRCYYGRGAFSRTTTVFVIISVLGFLSYMPSAIIVTMETENCLFPDQLSPQMFVTCSLLRVFYLFNHTANPIIYGIFDTKFRNEMKLLLWTVHS